MFNPEAKKENQIRYAIPVGTSNIIDLSKFMLDQRDTACKACKNGYKSMVSKLVGQTYVQVPIICTCVPYVQSQDEKGQLVVVFKGNREFWKTNKRPEVYIQKDIEIRGKITEVESNFAKLKKGSTAHDNINVGKYVVGVNKPASEMKGTKKSVEEQPKVAQSAKVLQKSELDKFLEKNGKRKSAFRTKENTIVVLDAETARRMGEAGLLSGTIAPAATKQPVAEEKKADVAKAKAGRPKGAKNKPKPLAKAIKA